MRTVLRISSGAIVWALHFTALYGFTALACSRGIAGAIPWVAGGTVLAALGALALIAYPQFGRGADFNAWMTLAVAGFALVGVIYETIPLFIVPICA